MSATMIRTLAALSTAAAVTVATVLTGGVTAHADPAFQLQMAMTGQGEFPIRWNPCQTEITYKVNTELAREKGRSAASARTQARTEITRAFGDIAEATGITFRYTGTTDEIPTSDDWWEKQGTDEEIVVAYVDRDKSSTRSSLLSSGAWGEGGQVYSYEGETVISGRGFAVFDRDKARQMRAGFGSGARRGNLVLHELGHVMGLDHVSDKDQLMYPTLSSKTPNGFAAGDLAGLAKLGQSGGCIADAEEFWEGS
jgi:hypothetical protein